MAHRTHPPLPAARRLVTALAAAWFALVPLHAGDEDAGPDALSAAQAAWVANRKVEALDLIGTNRLEAGRTYVADGLRSLEPPVVQASLRALRALPADGLDDIDLARSHLEHREHPIGIEAIRTAVALDDDRAVPALIGLANGDDPACRAAAGDAVRSLVPVDLPVQRERWAEWFATDHAAAVAALDRLDAIADKGGQDLATALRAVSALRNHRSLVAERVAPFLAHRDPAVGELARQVLRGLRGPVAMSILATAPSTTRSASVAAGVRPQPEAAAGATDPGLPSWVSSTWMVPVGIVLVVAIAIFLIGLKYGRQVRVGTARFIRAASERPGLAGRTARLVRSGGTLVGKTARLTRKVVRKITWGGQ
jgi:hypothetical protein